MLRDFTHHADTDLMAISKEHGFGDSTEVYVFFDTDTLTDYYVTFSRNSQLLGVHAQYYQRGELSELISLLISENNDCDMDMLRNVRGLKRVKDFDSLKPICSDARRNIVNGFKGHLEELFSNTFF